MLSDVIPFHELFSSCSPPQLLLALVTSHAVPALDGLHEVRRLQVKGSVTAERSAIQSAMSVWWLWEQLDARSAFIFIVVLLLVSDYLKNRNGKNFPPSPIWVPFIGDLFSMTSDKPHQYMAKIS
ncbi:vitamin D 25-hydroxylase-like isoform X2 [Erpetoichthys calabaricus]|uniref:vitamin D 25-hydroxylase-like isoform X2 n=1 Tax=Erpetoichthys calabaricus TaxID=27687 RepID=UPI0010A020AB|nr:vitamin D 25-hydroxylase-like isoform X2 [Erpetoichthys calabaricus]